jgi:hypothetical protein
MNVAQREKNRRSSIKAHDFFETQERELQIEVSRKEEAGWCPDDEPEAQATAVPPPAKLYEVRSRSSDTAQRSRAWCDQGAHCS